ncbi:MAG: polyisoprenoid-binding protein [Alphaproteobacteria bacterium]|nr:polyisoprenoid-binding protein [Alphaproteobacteria bacterium]
MKKFLMMAAVAGAVFAAHPAIADNNTHTNEDAAHYTFDKAHTQILFFVDHLGFSMSQGEFHDYDGHFHFNEKEPAKSDVEVVIQTASIDMDDEKWDEHMKNADFFNVEKFPTMTFKSTAIEVTSDNTANITGDMTILDVTKPVVLAVKHNKSDTHPFSGKYVSGFSATTTIKRSEFGMNYGLPGVGDDVEVRIEVEAVRTDETNTNE